MLNKYLYVSYRFVNACSFLKPLLQLALKQKLKIFVRPKILDIGRKQLPNKRTRKSTRAKLARFRATVVRCQRIGSCVVG